MTKILWVGDGPQFPTGFAQVTRNVCAALHRAGHEVHVLAVHHDGSTPSRDYPYPIHPASTMQDLCGFGRIREYVDFVQPDLIWLFSDLWVVSRWIERLRGVETPICVYFPVDSENLETHPEWVEPLKKTALAFTFTEFGRLQVVKAGFGRVQVLPHGADPLIFKPLNPEQRLAARAKYKVKPDTFVVLNANRNQPRKRIDLTIEGFCRFVSDYPEADAKLWLHMGTKDFGWDLLRLYKGIATRYGLDLSRKYLHLTHSENHHPNESLETVAEIYGCVDVMTNTSIGEGWGLVAHEGALCGVAQIVPQNSASLELWSRAGFSLPCSESFYDPETSLRYQVPSAQALGSALGAFYEDRTLLEETAKRCLERAMQFTWEPVVAEFVRLAANPPSAPPDCVALNADHHRRMAEQAQARRGEHNVAIGERDAQSREHLVQAMRKWKPDLDAPLRLLEVGAGFAGDREYLLNNLCDEYVGIEIVPAVAAKSGVYNLALDDLPVDWHGAFDFVYSRHVMEHVPDPAFSLSKIWDLLVPGGVVGAVTPHYFPDPEPAHLSQLTLEEWVNLYLSAGFEVCVAELKNYNCLEAHIVARRPK